MEMSSCTSQVAPRGMTLDVGDWGHISRVSVTREGDSPVGRLASRIRGRLVAVLLLEN